MFITQWWNFNKTINKQNDLETEKLQTKLLNGIDEFLFLLVWDCVMQPPVRGIEKIGGKDALNPFHSWIGNSVERFTFFLIILIEFSMKLE